MDALIKVLAAFAVILTASRLRAPLTVAVLAGAVVLGGLFGLGAEGLSRLMLAGVVEPKTLALVGITLILLMLSQVMSRSGQLERIVGAFAVVVRRPAVAMVTLPALIGLLPMPGGAIFSAPMVRQAVGKTPVPASTLSAVNYWFRHIWEYWWPMYPGVILAMTLTESDPLTFIRYQLPLGVLMCSSGLIFLFRGVHPDLHKSAPAAAPGTWRRLLRETSSIWIIIAVAVLAETGIRVAGEDAVGLTGPIRRYVPIAAGLLVSLTWTVRLNRFEFRQFFPIFSDRKFLGTAILILSVMVFQKVLLGVGAVGQIPKGLAEWHIPVVILVALLPLISGMVTGLAIGFVGTSFPVVIAMCEQLPGEPSIWPYIVLAYAFGHVGQMISPIHLCHVLSNQYFEITYRPMYRRLAGPAILFLMLASAYFLLLRAL